MAAVTRGSLVVRFAAGQATTSEGKLSLEVLQFLRQAVGRVRILPRLLWVRALPDHVPARLRVPIGPAAALASLTQIPEAAAQPVRSRTKLLAFQQVT